VNDQETPEPDTHPDSPETEETPSRWRQRLAGLKNTPFILRLVWRAAPQVLVLNLVTRVLTACLPVATLWVAKLIIDMVVASTTHPGPIPPRLWWLVAAEFGLAAGGSVLSRTIAYCEARLADELSREISLRVMRHATTLDLVSFEDPSFYDVLERARAQASDRVELLVAFGNLLQQTVTLVSLAAGVILFSVPVFLLLVVALVPAFIAETRFAFLGYSLAHSLTPLRRELDYIRMLGTSKEAAKETQVFALGRYLVDRFAVRNRELIARNRSLQVRRLRLGSLLAIVGLLGYYGSYAYVVWQALLGRLTIGTLTFLVGALGGTSAQIQSVFSTFAAIADQALFVSDLREFLAVAPRIRSLRRRARPVPQPIREGFTFQKVSFHYPGSDRLILDQLDLRIVPGERLALVGENGQGKTTCVKLLARLYEPTSGRILLDGIDLREYNLEDLHRQVGVIFQDFVRYDFTARENIGLGCVDQLADERRILEAAWNSHAADVLGRLPLGLEQMLGRRFAGGVELSGGEWQRIALARAYMCNAQILILDEPTAALDAASEADLFERFAALIEGRMAVLISHRFATVRMCDRIVVLEAGRVHEEGSHDELMAREGSYARLFRLQASQYT
jgi:ATP-binding cassette, subfamily B, bacterial